MDAPNQVKKEGVSLKASGGKWKARCALKCVKPAMMTQRRVPTTPNHSSLVRRAMTVMRRYRRKTANRHTNMARNGPLVTRTEASIGPQRGPLAKQVGSERGGCKPAKGNRA